ncbi:helix-turn-helix domain-containing protein [Roseospira navarrensis]|uniref:HTH cro/C1-type domain-containing protein n=1 Tax=Roseospira navarrensis TaxID=140058 RepID=A0A7X1ZHZ7_9PROT|nr:helix-turn-helix transcriptional regulator [Roseospira navarrensis]MQX38613.1 hypothetical protein [Roseospira navarrensis]
MSLGSRLRSFITLNGLSVRDLERQTGIPYRSLHEYLSDKRKPGADHMAKLCTTGIDIEWLLTGSVRPGLHFSIAGKENGFIYFDMGGVSEFEPMTGDLISDERIYTLVKKDAVSLVNQMMADHPRAAASMGIEGIVSTLWVSVHTYMSALEPHKDKILEALEKGYSIDSLAELMLEPIRARLLSRFHAFASQDGHNDTQGRQ